MATAHQQLQDVLADEDRFRAILDGHDLKDLLFAFYEGMPFLAENEPFDNLSIQRVRAIYRQASGLCEALEDIGRPLLEDYVAELKADSAVDSQIDEMKEAI